MSITRISIDSQGNQSINTSYNPSISNDGNYVAFASDASNIVAEDTNESRDIFVRDIETETTTRISISNEGVEADGDSENPSISADGNFIAFTSDATNLVEEDTNGDSDIFVYDRENQQTTRISVDGLGNEGNSDSENPSISADGNYIAFTSDAINLVTGDTNARSDIFVHNRETGSTTRVSIDSSENQADDDSENPSISANGNYVVFASDASNLVENDTNNSKDIFLRNLTTGETTRVSLDSDGNEVNGDSDNPSISADGNYIAFASDASNLVEGDENSRRDIFVRNLETGETSRISVDSDGNEADDTSDNPSISISESGSYVAFTSNATNLVAGDENNAWDIFVHDLTTGETIPIDLGSDGKQANDFSSSPDFSADGNYIAFTSNADNLVPEDTNEVEDIFVTNNSNDAPTVLNSIGGQTATEDSEFSFTIDSETFLDVDAGDSLTLSANTEDVSELPTWLNFDSSTNTFSGTPTNDDVGTVNITVTATDTESESVSDNFTLTVENTNDAPTVANIIEDQTATEDSEFSFTVPSETFLDVDASDSLTLSAIAEDGSELPTWLSFDAETQTFSGTPTNDDVGTLNIKVTATDTESESVSDTFTLTVGNTNDAPTVDDVILKVDENSEEGTEVGTITATDSDNQVLTFAIIDGNLDSDNDDNLAFAIDSETGVITVNDSDELDFETNPSFDLEVTATDDESSDTQSVTVNLNDIDAASFDTSESDNGFFTLDGGDSSNLKFTLASNDTENINELGVFVVDDKFGAIDGATTDSYLQAALQRSQVIFSGVSNRPSGFDLEDIERILEFEGDASFGFYLVSNGTTDTVLNDLETTGTTDLSVFFSTSDNLELSDLSTAGFNLNWSDETGGSDFTNMEILVELTDETSPLATELQGKPENELIDLRDVTDSVSVSVEVHREAAFDNLVGFYQIADGEGGIDTSGDGIADINVGDTGYEQAALENRITGLDLLQTENQQTSSFDGILEGGSLLASFMVVDATVDEALNDSAEVYFSFMGANSDGVDHVRLLGDNTFGYEDLAGGDNDFNDMIVNLKFS